MNSEKMCAFFDRFVIEMTLDQALSASHPGPCDEDVAVLVFELSEQLDKLDPAEVAAELSEYGAWDPDELCDHNENLERITWIAAGNIREEVAL